MNSTDLSIKHLSDCTFDELYAAHLRAFKDYPFQWSKEALKKTISRRGFEPSLSFGAFDKNELVSFTWNGIGWFPGLRTVYDTGTGTAEDYRGKGLASKIFEYSVPHLKAAGMQQYILEVLEENEKAFSVYSKQGFKVSRKFDCFRTQTSDWNFREMNIPADVKLKEIDLSYRSRMEAMLDFELSWQNNFAALNKCTADLRVIGAFKNDALIGYGIIEPVSGDIPQLAVARSERRKGLGTYLLAELKKLNRAEIVKVVNIESGKDHITQFVLKSGIPKIVSQFEMLRAI